MIDMVADGWFFSRQKGNYKQYKHLTKKGIFTIPDHGKNEDLECFLVSSILKQAGLKWEHLKKHSMMNKVIVDIYFTGNNYCAYAPILLGCVSTASTLAQMKRYIKEAIEFHVESSLEENDPIPEIFKGEFELEFKLSEEALLNAYSDIFTKAALSRITGINKRQLWHYASTVCRPLPASA